MPVLRLGASEIRDKKAVSEIELCHVEKIGMTTCPGATGKVGP
ncbi:MAG: hypothetical protein QOH34_1422, partial [Mycobacterium sp.]|nr:hypothetical protein [Mycobacterium sp.]